jgi:UDP-N-acetylglucosamine:LPS N-acetylglucosamine transferase
VQLDNDKLSDELLLTLASLLDDEAHLDAMKQCARSLARPQAASDQAAQLREMAGA